MIACPAGPSYREEGRSLTAAVQWPVLSVEGRHLPDQDWHFQTACAAAPEPTACTSFPCERVPTATADHL
eukprot:5856402-Prymnesium_polylepis.1